MYQFCVFTPTYNRAYTLERLFKSLKRQTYQNFEWVVLDDGSTDGTNGMVFRFIADGSIPITYLRTENRGKTRAVNQGIELCRDELFICVDSDDWLDDRALQVFHEKWEGVKCDSSIAGMIALHGNPDGSPVGGRMPRGVARTNAWDLYNKYHFKGDAIHVYRSEIFRSYPAPVADGEKFLSEGYAIHEIAKKYDVALIDEVLHLGEYLPDGYTNNVRKLTKDNPKGYMLVKKQSIEMSQSILQKGYNTILYEVGCLLAGESPIAGAPSKALAVVCLPFAFLLRCTVYH